jgi:transcriptional regulator with XRE-family HTH domain
VRAQVSTRHLSYVETGRSVPSRELVLHLAELLEVPLRERNGLLLAAGYAPVFSARTLEDDSSGMPYVRQAVARLLASHEPYPALVALAEEVRSYPGVSGPAAVDPNQDDERVVVPLRLRNDGTELCLLNMVATFGTAVDVTTAELVIESFYPADELTSRVFGHAVTAS